MGPGGAPKILFMNNAGGADPTGARQAKDSAKVPRNSARTGKVEKSKTPVFVVVEINSARTRQVEKF